MLNKNFGKMPGALALFVILLSSVLMSCTRPQNEDTTVRISLPTSMSSQKLNAQSADTLGHVVINVTGEGIPAPIVYNWDFKQDGMGTALAKPIELTIPQGANRLIQVLAVYYEAVATTTLGSSVQFYYGDKVQSFSQASETVTLAVSSVGQASSIFSGRISGRYLSTAGGSGPTGIIVTSYVPTNGRPPVIIERDMMYAGWFSVMGLYGASFSYLVNPFGEAPFALFEGRQVDLSEASFPPSATLARLTIPASQRRNSASTWQLESPAIHIYGFWGANSGTNACVKSTPQTTQYAIGNSTSPASSLLLADVSGTVPGDFATNIALPSMYLQAATGTANNTGACAGAVNFNNALVIDPQQADNGNDGAPGLAGPFKMTSGRALTVTGTAPAFTLNANMLPGTAAIISGFQVYKKIGSSDYLPDSLYCMPEALTAQGFQPLAQGSLAAGDTTWTQNISVTAAEVTSLVSLAICPLSRATGTMFPLGVYVKPYQFISGGYNNTLQPATKLAIVDYNPNPAYNYCSRFLVEAQTSTGTMGEIHTPMRVQFPITTNATIYTDAGCLVSATTPFMEHSRAYFYMKAMASTTATSVNVDYFDGNVGGGSLAASPATVQTSGPPSPTAHHLAFYLEQIYTRQPFECIPFYFSVVAASGSEISSSVMSGNGMTPTLSGDLSGGTFYLDSGCGDPFTSIPGSNWSGYAGKTLVPFWVRFTGSGTGGFSATTTNSLLTPSAVPYTIAPATGGPATQIVVNATALPGSPAQGVCYPISVELYDSSHWPSVQAAATTGTVSITAGTAACTSNIALYTSKANCGTNTGGATSQALTVPVGENRVVLWQKHLATLTGTCGIQATLITPTGLNDSSAPRNY